MNVNVTCAALAELRLIRSCKGQPEPGDVLEPLLGFMLTTTASFRRFLGVKDQGDMA